MNADKCILFCPFFLYLRSAELRVNELVASDQRNPQLSGDHSSARLDSHIVALTDVVDVHRNGSIGANPKLLHLRDELTLCQVIWCRSLTLQQHSRGCHHTELTRA